MRFGSAAATSIANAYARTGDITFKGDGTCDAQGEDCATQWRSTRGTNACDMRRLRRLSVACMLRATDSLPSAIASPPRDESREEAAGRQLSPRREKMERARSERERVWRGVHVRGSLLLWPNFGFQEPTRAIFRQALCLHGSQQAASPAPPQGLGWFASGRPLGKGTCKPSQWPNKCPGGVSGGYIGSNYPTDAAEHRRHDGSARDDDDGNRWS